MFKNILGEKRGLTLIEVLVTVVIAGIIFSVALSLQFFGLRSYSMGTSQAEVQQNARLINEVIRNELRNATSVGDEEKENLKELNFSSNTLFFGNTSFELEGISNVSLARKTNRTLEITVKGNGYELVNEVYLNNYALPEGIDLNFPLVYTLPD